MARKRRLNIGNTDRVFNLTLVDKSDFDYSVVTTQTQDEITKHIEQQAKESGLLAERDDKHYLIFKSPLANDSLNQNLFRYGGQVTYYSDGVVPYPIVQLLSENRKFSKVCYQFKKQYDIEEIKNVNLVAMAGTVVLDLPIVYSQMTPYQVLVSLFDLRYKVDRVELAFPALSVEDVEGNPSLREFYIQSESDSATYELKSEYKYEFFDEIRDSLSSWKMNVFLICDNEKDHKRLAKLQEVDSKKRKGSSIW